MVKRRKQKEKVCASGSARRCASSATSLLANRDQTTLQLEFENPVNAKIIGAPLGVDLGFLPGAIYIRGNPDRRKDIFTERPQPTWNEFLDICHKYTIAPDACRALLHDLTKARLILGYKHPLVRCPKPNPTSGDDQAA